MSCSPRWLTSRYEATQTLPEKFSRMLQKTGLAEKVKGKTVAIKMHVGDGVTYSTIPRSLCASWWTSSPRTAATASSPTTMSTSATPERRGYTESNLGCPVLDDCSYTGKYFYTKQVDYKGLKHVDVAGLIHDAT